MDKFKNNCFGIMNWKQKLECSEKHGLCVKYY